MATPRSCGVLISLGAVDGWRSRMVEYSADQEVSTIPPLVEIRRGKKAWMSGRARGRAGTSSP